MKEFFKTLKGKITIIATAVVVVAIVLLVLLLTHKDTYRNIAIEQLSGNVTVTGEKNNGQAYVGQRFYSGDDVRVASESDLTMCMDQDKYVYADPETHFVLQASSAKEDSRISIWLDEGSTLHELNSKLEANETYEVDTPSSTMSVRGTTFRVSVFNGSDDMVYTLTEVDEGEVVIRLKSTDGTYNGIEKSFIPGQSALVRANDEISEFVTSDMISPDGILDTNSGDPEVLVLSYAELSDSGVERIEALIAGVDRKIEEDAAAAKAAEEEAKKKAEEEEKKKAEEEAAAEAEEEAEAEAEAEEETEAEETQPEQTAEEQTQEAAPAPAESASSSDVDAIAAYATSLGYNVYKYKSQDGTNTFQCSYSDGSKGKIYTSVDALLADSSGPLMKYVLVSFTTSDFATVSDESAYRTDYNDPLNMFTTIVAKRPFTSLDATYQLLADAKSYY